MTTNDVFPISGRRFPILGSVSNTVSIPGTMNVGSENNGLTNYIKASNNEIVGSISNTFQSVANNFIGINSFTAGAVNINDVATFNSGFKCAKQLTPYNIFMGIATYVSSSEANSSNLVPPYAVYGDCNATYELNQSISNVQSMFISPNNTNFSMWYVAMLNSGKYILCKSY